MKYTTRYGKEISDTVIEQPTHEQERIKLLNKFLSIQSLEIQYTVDRQAREMASKKFGKAGHTTQAVKVCRYEILEEMIKNEI